jgi:biotin carboxylase
MKNIFVFGLDEFNLSQLQTLRGAEGYRFLELFSHDEVKAGPEFPVQRLLEGAREKLDAFPDTVDAIVGYWDFPVSTLLPLLRAPLGLPSPSFEAVLKCEHKYWSRVLQKEVVPEQVPNFCSVDPFQENPRQQITLDYPFWLKPVKSAGSYLGFKVRNDAEFRQAIGRIRKGIHRFGRPFNYLLAQAQLPEAIAAVDGNHCIAEQIISRGRQCTQEGYVYQGETVVYGTIDSIREGRHRSSFSRYQYPSRLPRRVQQRMTDITCRVMTHFGYDTAPFNIEFYWDEAQDSLFLLEINARISKSHCPLFFKVDGAYHHQVMVEIALGRRPEFPHRQGRHRMAAKFMWRESRDGLMKHVPTPRELRDIAAQFPSAEIQLHVKEGMRLSDLPDQDSYSYEVGVIFLGGDSQKQLLEKYRACRQAIPLQLEPVD